ncbi:MAG: hypothetical protein OEY52_00750 [Gammaproteobacteria bacterium]|nr:hypothetical protein [Gammaproteobacteria bacterium]
MAEQLLIEHNGNTVLQYDRNIRLPGHQRRFLDKMDEDMAEGIQLAGQSIEEPNPIQKAQFVAVQLMSALQQSEDGLIAATCAYLANRFPEMRKVVATEQGDNISLDLVFNEQGKQNTVAVNFQPNLH